MARNTSPSLVRLNYARNLANQLGVENKYRWDQDYWTVGELDALIYGLEKRVKYS